MSPPIDFHGYVRARLARLTTARDPEIVAEVAQHLEDVYREAREAGLDHAAAWARAEDAMPSAPGERRAWARLLRLADIRRDIRHALRTMIREPAFTIAIVVTLALGIGATTAIFSAVDAVLLAPPPVAAPDRLANVYTVWAARATTSAGRGDQLGAASYPDYADLRDSGILDGLAAFAEIGLSLDANGVTERIDAALVSGNYFDVLGVHPAAGRSFAGEEDRIGAPIRVVMLSHRIWQQRFGGDAGIVGRPIVLNGREHTVIGIAPRAFAGTDLGNAFDAWLPMALQPEVRPASAGAARQRPGGAGLLAARDAHWLRMVGRLWIGRSLADTAAALEVVGRRLSAAHPESNRDLGATAVPLGEGPGVRADTRPLLALLGAAVALVLLIACANVASLLLARAVTRRREVAIRMAIGASRAQLVRQWLTESVLLGVTGSVAGLIVAALARPILYGVGLPEDVDIGLNPRVLAAALATGTIAGLTFGLAPVLQLIRRETLTAVRDEGGAVTTGARATRLRSAFVVLQVALSLVLLVGAGLFLRTLQQAWAVDLGYRVDRLLLADLALDERYSPEAARAFHVDLLDRLNAVPGVTSAAAARVTVLSGTARTVPVSLDGQPLRQDRINAIAVRANVVSDRYLETMGIRVVHGRGFDPTDDHAAARVAIVSRSLADRLWPGADPIGRPFLSTTSLQVVGVVPDTIYLSATERDPRPFFYVPLAQSGETLVSLHVRTDGDPLALLPAVRGIVRDLDPRLALTRPRRLADERDRSLARQQTMATLVGLLSGVALLLAAVGLYGVMTYVTRQRTSEVGLRLALGATPRSILALFVVRGARLVAIGGALGVAGAFAGARYVRSHLFGVAPSDPLTWLSVCAVLAAVGLMACVLPARRAMRIDPVTALRSS